jgi:hypothetical protein
VRAGFINTGVNPATPAAPAGSDAGGSAPALRLFRRFHRMLQYSSLILSHVLSNQVRQRGQRW